MRGKSKTRSLVSLALCSDVFYAARPATTGIRVAISSRGRCLFFWTYLVSKLSEQFLHDGIQIE